MHGDENKEASSKNISELVKKELWLFHLYEWNIFWVPREAGECWLNRRGSVLYRTPFPSTSSLGEWGKALKSAAREA